MFTTLKNAWGIPDLRKKMMYTVLIVIIYRFGCVVPVPFINATALSGIVESTKDSGIDYINMLTGGAFNYAGLFAMGITPYINSSIIMQLLTIAIPPLERMAKEGEGGRKKIATITRYVTVALGLIQGVAYYFYLRSLTWEDTANSQTYNVMRYMDGFPAVFSAITIVLTLTAGTALIMWMGEKINDKGIGNGISIILFAGIIARMPVTFGGLWKYFSDGLEDVTNYGHYLVLVPLFVLIFLAVIWIIVYMNEAERRIPVQYAKKVVGRKMYGGQSSFLPVKVSMSGVMPVIFASSILALPTFIQKIAHIPEDAPFWGEFFKAFSTSGWVYCVVYFLLILMFAYFYMSIQYNPLEMANNLRESNGAIPGIRPGRPTADFIQKILSKITLIGAIFLSVVALVPIIYGNISGISGVMLGGTSVIIIVGVALETAKQLESQMMMRHYKGFLD